MEAECVLHALWDKIKDFSSEQYRALTFNDAKEMVQDILNTTKNAVGLPFTEAMDFEKNIKNYRFYADVFEKGAEFRGCMPGALALNEYERGLDRRNNYVRVRNNEKVVENKDLEQFIDDTFEEWKNPQSFRNIATDQAKEYRVKVSELEAKKRENDIDR